MTDEALRQLWKTYQDAWAPIPSEERDRLLRASLAEDISFTSVDNDARGLHAMIATVANFQANYPGFYFRSTMLRQQHGQMLSAWTMFSSEDAPVVNGHSYAQFDEAAGRITSLAGFWKL